MDDIVTPTVLAYHEAGHAVVNRHFGIPVLYVTIVPNEMTEGHVRLRTHPTPDRVPPPTER